MAQHPRKTPSAARADQPPMSIGKATDAISEASTEPHSVSGKSLREAAFQRANGASPMSRTIGAISGTKMLSK